MICEGCHEDKEDVEECLDPYAEEISGEEIETQLCKSCYRQYCDDI